jgi:hypothetical protein
MYVELDIITLDISMLNVGLMAMLERMGEMLR